MKMNILSKRGFTLIELLVVISIIGVLSSVVLASVTQAREKAQNAARLESTRQIDLAIQLYESTNGHAPLLQGTCGKDPILGFPTVDPGCVAVQTATDPDEVLKWTRFQQDLAPYMSKLPVDPCGTSCGLKGYTYVAPASVYFGCKESSECDESRVTESDYSINTYLTDAETVARGYSTVGAFFASPSSDFGNY